MSVEQDETIFFVVQESIMTSCIRFSKILIMQLGCGRSLAKFSPLHIETFQRLILIWMVILQKLIMMMATVVTVAVG